MRNLLSANLHRLKKSRAFWGCEIVSALYALFLGFELYLDMKKNGYLLAYKEFHSPLRMGIVIKPTLFSDY